MTLVDPRQTPVGAGLGRRRLLKLSVAGLGAAALARAVRTVTAWFPGLHAGPW
jgi:hypothetical protein